MAYLQYDLDDLKRHMEERWDGVPFWDEFEAQDAINESLLVWNSLTGFWKRRVQVNTVANQGDYELPSTIVYGMRVYYRTTNLEPASLSDMDYHVPTWYGQTGTPRKWIPLDLNTIRLWPAPTDANESITVDGVAATPQLLYDADHVDIGIDVLGAIIGYALHAVALKEGGERFAATQQYFQEFLSVAAEHNNQLEKSAIFRKFMGITDKNTR